MEEDAAKESAASHTAGSHAPNINRMSPVKHQVVSWVVLLVPIIALTTITETSLDLFALSPERGGRKEGLSGVSMQQKEAWRRKQEKRCQANHICRRRGRRRAPTLGEWEEVLEQEEAEEARRAANRASDVRNTWFS